MFADRKEIAGINRTSECVSLHKSLFSTSEKAF